MPGLGVFIKAIVVGSMVVSARWIGGERSGF